MRARKLTSVTKGVAKETRRSCPPWLEVEAALQELRLMQSSSSESRDNRSGQPSSLLSLKDGGSDVDDDNGPLEHMLSASDVNGGFRGKLLPERHVVDNLAVSRKRRIASGSNLMAVMVVLLTNGVGCCCLR